MAKLSNMVLRRQQAAEWLRSSVRTHGWRAAEALQERLALVVEEGEQVPDVGHFVEVLTRMLEREGELLGEFDFERWKGTASVDGLRFHRGPVAEELRAGIVDLRQKLVGLYGATKANHILDIKGRTPRGHEDLAAYGERLIQRLRRMELPEPKPGFAVDPGTWADELEPLVKRLSEIVGMLHGGAVGEGDGVIGRNRVLGDFDADYVPVIRLVESVYLLAGEPERARRLRPSFRRRLVNRSAAMGGGGWRSWFARMKSPWGRRGEKDPDIAQSHQKVTQKRRNVNIA